MNYQEKKRWFIQSVEYIDIPLLIFVLAISLIGLISLYSAQPERIWSGVRNLIIALIIMWIVACRPPNDWLRLALPIYIIGLFLLLGVALFGDVAKGARRWLDLRILRIQPAEMMKIAVPLVLAWYFHRRAETPKTVDFLIALVLLFIPTALIIKQPDLGTAILVFSAGFYVLFFIGFSWLWISLSVLVLAVSSPFFCGIPLPQILGHPLLHDYQCRRITVLFDPSIEPLGAGYHTIQAMIAIGSGGWFGKGWLQGTQAYLSFIPERHTDFIFAVYSEEFGLFGNIILGLLYMGLIARGLIIAGSASSRFGRLLASSLSMGLLTYIFVNIGMVSGILPVVGVPLPMMSYGGTSLVTLLISIGMLMSIYKHRGLIQQ